MATTVAVISAVAGAAKAVSDHKKLKAEQKYIKQEKLISDIKDAKQQEIYEKEKTNLLKTKLAQKKAMLASRGLDYTNGSAAAIMGNMERETDLDIDNSRYMSALNTGMNEAKYNYKKNKNLLDRVNNGLGFVSNLKSLL